MYKVFLIFISIVLTPAYCYDYEVEYQGFFSNPYRELGIPPWSSLNEVKAKYDEIANNYHIEKKLSFEQFRKLQRAYEVIAARRKVEFSSNENEWNQSGLYKSLSKTFKVIFQVSILLWALYGIIWLAFRLFQFFIKPMICLAISFIVIDKLVPHYFRNGPTQYIFSIFCAIAIYIVNKLARWTIRKIFFKTKVEELGGSK